MLFAKGRIYKGVGPWGGASLVPYPLKKKYFISADYATLLGIVTHKQMWTDE